MINNDLIKKFFNIKEQLESCFKEFITQVIKDNGYIINITVYSVQVQVGVNDILIDTTFVFNSKDVDEPTFYIDSKTTGNIERTLREQIEEYFEDVMEEYSDD